MFPPASRSRPVDDGGARATELCDRGATGAVEQDAIHGEADAPRNEAIQLMRPVSTVTVWATVRGIIGGPKVPEALLLERFKSVPTTSASTPSRNC
jgi:hypothetical protein